MEIRNGGAVNILQKNFGNFFGDGTEGSVCLWLCIGIYHRTNKSGQYLFFKIIGLIYRLETVK